MITLSIFQPTTRLHSSFLVLLGIVLMTFASQLSIPFIPVPLTFQSTTAILIGMLYGARYGFYTLALYVVATILGAPLGANYMGGIEKLWGPTAGYFLSFPFAAFISGYLMERNWAKNWFSCLLVGLMATCLIFACGVAWLTHLTNLQQAINFGLLPFLLSEPIKLLPIAFITPRCWQH